MRWLRDLRATGNTRGMIENADGKRKRRGRDEKASVKWKSEREENGERCEVEAGYMYDIMEDDSRMNITTKKEMKIIHALFSFSRSSRADETSWKPSRSMSTSIF